MKNYSDLTDKQLQRARKIIQKHFGGRVDDYVIESLKGGASTRSFFRVFIPRLPVNGSGILMLENKKFSLLKSDFYQVSELLRKLYLPVPAIYEDMSKLGALYLQDLGDTHLFDLAEILEGDDSLTDLYRQALDYIIKLQTRAPFHSKDINAFDRAFDEKKLMWELDFMLKHFATATVGVSFSKDQKKVLDSFFQDLVAQIAALPRVMCHRDYHSQNLMLWNERLHIVDFQDARMGPHLYDVVSLLGDSYVEIKPETRAELLKYYVDNHPELTEDIHEYQRQYSLVAIQRHLKHLGTFGYLNVQDKPESMQYVPRTIEFIRGNLKKFEAADMATPVLEILFEKSLEAAPSGE